MERDTLRRLELLNQLRLTEEQKEDVITVEENIMDEPEDFFKEKEISRKAIFVGKKRLRDPRKYITANQIYKDMRYAI